jgi:hypothetical protein
MHPPENAIVLERYAAIDGELRAYYNNVRLNSGSWWKHESSVRFDGSM